MGHVLQRVQEEHQKQPGHGKAGYHILSIGPYEPFLDPTPLWAAHLVGEGGKLTIMDSQMGGLRKRLSGRGGHIGRGSRDLGIGDLDWFRWGMSNVVRDNWMSKPKYVVGRMQEMPLKSHSVNTILEKNMLFGLGGDRRGEKQISREKSLEETLDEYDRILKPGGHAIEAIEQDIMGLDSHDRIVEAFRRRGYDVEVYEGVNGLRAIPDAVSVSLAKEELGEWFQEHKGPKAGVLVVARKPGK